MINDRYCRFTNASGYSKINIFVLKFIVDPTSRNVKLACSNSNKAAILGDQEVALPRVWDQELPPRGPTAQAHLAWVEPNRTSTLPTILEAIRMKWARALEQAPTTIFLIPSSQTRTILTPKVKHPQASEQVAKNQAQLSKRRVCDLKALLISSLKSSNRTLSQKR